MSQDVLTLALRETVENLSTGLPPPSALFASAPAIFNVEGLMADLVRAQPLAPASQALAPQVRSFAVDALQWLRENGRSVAGGTVAGATFQFGFDH